MTVAIDVGLKRIGIAIAYENGVILPLDAIIRKNRNQASDDLKHVLSVYKATKLVVGIPLGGSSEDEMRRRIKHFVSLINFQGEIIFIDESYTSKEASDFGIVSHKKKDGKLDSLSAMIILQRYINK